MQMSFQILILIVVLNFSLTSLAEKTTNEWRSTSQQTHLLELFTSEGCHSCPPADRWFTTLKSDPGLWKDFVPVGFHVDYWNYLGWDDKLSDRKFSDRQRLLARKWEKPRVYTPGFILDGKEYRTRSDRNKKMLRKDSKSNVGILSDRQLKPGIYQVTFNPTKVAKKNKLDKKYRVFASLLAMNTSTAVKAGENANVKLTHDFGVCAFKLHDLKPLKNTYSKVVDLRKCDSSVFQKNARAVAFWVSENDSLTPIQATGGMIN